MDVIDEIEENYLDVDITFPTECQTDPTLMNIAHRDSRNAGQSVITELFKREEISMTRKKLLEKLSERRASFRPQPLGTVVYEVQGNDTLASIAARCNITPSELVNLNKLSCRTIFPGQIIFIPDKTALAVDLPNVLDVKQATPILEQESPKPGHVERVQSPVGHSHDDDVVRHRISPRATPSVLAEELDKESVEQSLKINVKYITDGEGVVSGVLLVTPNLVMFDPNVSDPLVIEHGTEKYGVVAPMHMVVRAALYPDIMRMRVKDAPDSGVTPKMPDLYHSKNLPFGRSRTEEKIDPPPDQTKTAARRHSSVCEKISTESVNFSFSKSKFKQHNKSSEALSDATDDENCLDKMLDPSNSKSKRASEISNSSVGSERSGKPTETQKSLPIKFAQSKGLTSSVPSLDSGLEKHFTTVAHSHSFTEKKSSRKKSSSEEEELSCDSSVKDTKKKKYDFEKAKQKLQRGLRKLSITDGLFPGVSHSLNNRRISLPSSPHSVSELKAKSTPSTSQKRKTSAPGSDTKDSNSTTYRNVVDEKPDLFMSFDKIIPRPAQSFDHSPLYLCLRMGKPIKKPLHRSTPVMHYGRKVKSEYWFSIPQARVDSLYLFFLRWTPQTYGDIDVTNFEELGFLPIGDTDDEDEELLAETSYAAERRKSSWAFPWKRRKSKDVELSKPDDLSPVDWEFISPESEEREPSIEADIVPELLSPSSILKEDQIKLLCVHLPARAIGYAWTLIYSTALHGFSLKTLYREMYSHDTPVLLVVCTTTGAVFGALLSCPLRISDHFYGTGESFLFTFHPEFKCYPWAGENAYFIKGNASSFAIGASEGKFGLWLDDDLFHGRTQECITYANEPLCEEEDFVVKALEAWGFV